MLLKFNMHAINGNGRKKYLMWLYLSSVLMEPQIIEDILNVIKLLSQRVPENEK